MSIRRLGYWGVVTAIAVSAAWLPAPVVVSALQSTGTAHRIISGAASLAWSTATATATSVLVGIRVAGASADPTMNGRTIAAGSFHACALTDVGGVKCWGRNAFGQLGDGTNTDRDTPVDVVGLTSGVAAIAVGGNQTCALTVVGGVKCWGAGPLGDGTETSNPLPVDVVGLRNGVKAISTGWSLTCALTTAGGIKCWGVNYFGQLGDGTNTDQDIPVDVLGLTSGVAAISAGSYHACALTVAGAVKCWGRNADGELGDGTTTDQPTPVDVVGLTSGVSTISAGAHHSCVLTTSGGVKCWGDNYMGELGDGTTTVRSFPVDVLGLSSGVRAISAGGYMPLAGGGDRNFGDHTCALTTVGGVKCWGGNYFGELGDGTTTDRSAPVNVSGLSGGMSAITTGGLHTCVATTAGGVQCWGSNDSGQLGNGATTHYTVPIAVNGTSGGVSAIVLGTGYTCALNTAGGVQCRGHNNTGQLGDGTTASRYTAADVSGLTTGVSAISAGDYHACALTVAGGVKCWGDNSHGQLGDGTTTTRYIPVNVSGLASGIKAISAGGYHTCALTTAGGVKCWGSNYSGQLGDGTTTERHTPVSVSGLTSGVKAISTSGSHTCALTTAGGVKCWGSNYSGQLGDGTTTERHTPVSVSGLTSGVSAISTGGSHTCALTTAGSMKCWGSNSSGQLGDGTTTTSYTPVSVSGLASGVKAISTGGSHTCALTTAGAVKCWGSNSSGQLGDGTTTTSYTPVSVSGLASGVKAISTGESHTCALTTAGGVKCWGNDYYGQLGLNPGWTPVDVVDLHLDVTPPTNPTSLSSSSHVVSAWSSDNTVDVTWSGAGDSGTGIGGYAVTWDNLPTSVPSPTKTLDPTSTGLTSLALSDGLWYFHIRSMDNAGNWADTAAHLGPFNIDTTPPTSAASAPLFATAPFTVTWQGADAGSGLASYDVWVRDGASGAWTQWLAAVTATQAVYTSTAVGHVYSFRTQARDAVYNLETAVDVPANGDASTTVAQWQVSGHVLNTRGEPVFNATLNSSPAALNVATSDRSGSYVFYYAASGTYTLTALRAGYGTLPPLSGQTVSGDLSGVDFVLPPQSDAVANGTFEQPSSQAWTIDPQLSATLEMSAAHTGQYGLDLQVASGIGLDQAASSAAVCVTQSVTIIAGWQHPTLAWAYQVVSGGAGSQFVVSAAGSQVVSQTVALVPGGWTQGWLDVSALQGQVVTLCLGFTDPTQLQQVYVDDVTLGDAVPGVRLLYLPVTQR